MELSIQNFNLSGKKVLVRTDFNVPLDVSNHVTDDARLRAVLPTCRWVLDQGGSLIFASHMGRPKGEKNQKESLQWVIPKLESLLGQKVLFSSDCIGENASKAKKNLKAGEVLLLENLRFHLGEEKPDSNPNFAKDLAKYSEAYINEAFSCSHRDHSSITRIQPYIQGPSGIGLHFEKELKAYNQYLKKPKRPFVALIGGSKISSKIKVLKSLIDQVDSLYIGGAMAHTFLTALGYKVGRSLNEPDFIPAAKEILQTAEKKGVQLYLPQDLRVVHELDQPESLCAVSVDEVPSNSIAVDIGPKTLSHYFSTLESSQTIFWNGPMGLFENPNYALSTFKLAEYLANHPAITFVGGGDSAAALAHAGYTDQMTFVSTGGGACLKLIEKGTLKGLDAFKNL